MEILMKTKQSFFLLGKEKMGDCSKAGEWIAELWREVNQSVEEIAPFIKQERDSLPIAGWGLMGNADKSFLPSQKEGVYLAGYESLCPKEPLEGWTIYEVPGYKYAVVTCTADTYEAVFKEVLYEYMPEKGYNLIGPVLECYDPRGKAEEFELYFPVQKTGEVHYAKATAADLDEILDVRLKVLREVNHLPEDIDLQSVKENSYGYFSEGFLKGAFVMYLARLNTKIIGIGGISFYTVMPTYHNPTGKKAYIMNMYTEKAYRGRGIGRSILEMLIEEAKRRGVFEVTLEAVKDAKPFYQMCGFETMNQEMRYLW